MRLGVCKETFPGESRVAIVPQMLPALAELGLEVCIEQGAGEAAGFPDALYAEKGASLLASRDAVFEAAELMAQVRLFEANPQEAQADLQRIRSGQCFVALCEPLTPSPIPQQAAQKGADIFAMELIPRISRAQSMDVLSSMATLAGYKAVLIAANRLPRLFPLMMTAAGTLNPAKVLVLGVGVAGLQAIATAKRLGAVVEAYDVRPAVKEQVESLGAKFVELDLEAGDAEDKGGYAKAQSEDFYRKQQELMGEVIGRNDVVITTAAIPGKKAPILVTAAQVRRMAPGSVIVDLAAERGGNCELTQLDKTVIENGVMILGPGNLASTVPMHASQMYAKNVTMLLKHIIREEQINWDLDDEITRGTLMCHGGEVVHPMVRAANGLD